MHKNFLWTMAMFTGLTLAACDSTKEAADGTPDRMPEPVSDTPQTATPGRSAPVSPSPEMAEPTLAPEGRPNDDSTLATNGERSTEKVMDDTWITTKVKTALLAESDLKSSGIQVETMQGKVMLTGKVKSASESEKASKLARGIEGVTDVRNQLTIAQ